MYCRLTASGKAFVVLLLPLRPMALRRRVTVASLEINNCVIIDLVYTAEAPTSF